MTEQTTDFDVEVVDKVFPFFGASENQFKLGDKVWEALEDEDDGYRSYLGSVEIVASKAIFFNQPIATVMIKYIKEEVNEHGIFNGYKLVDIADDHVWLRFGTDNSDDYYPWFVFEYQPKETKNV